MKRAGAHDIDSKQCIVARAAARAGRKRSLAMKRRGQSEQARYGGPAGGAAAELTVATPVTGLLLGTGVVLLGMTLFLPAGDQEGGTRVC